MENGQSKILILLLQDKTSPEADEKSSSAKESKKAKVN